VRELFDTPSIRTRAPCSARAEARSKEPLYAIAGQPPTWQPPVGSPSTRAARGDATLRDREPATFVSPQRRPVLARERWPHLLSPGLKKHFLARQRLSRREGDVVKAVDGIDFPFTEVRRSPHRRIRLWQDTTSKLIPARATDRRLDRVRGPRHRASRAELMSYRARAVVFQDPFSSLSPRCAWVTSSPSRSRSTRGSRAPDRERVAQVLALVAWRPTSPLFPHEFSGGQRQRIAIARRCD